MPTPDNIEFITRYTEDLFDALTENFNKCKDEANITSVHDCRVSLRRLMALIDVLSCLHPDEKKTLATSKKALKKLQKRFSPVRDIHVSEKYIIDNIASLCDSKSYLEWLASEADIIEEKLINDLNQAKFSKYSLIRDKMIRLFLGITSEAALTKTLYATLDDVFLEAIERLEKLDLNNIETFHSVRISLKRFRYTLEIVNLIDSAYKSSLDDLKRLQDYLGEIQDLTVLKNALMNCSPALKHEFEYDCMLGIMNERLSFLTNRFYTQRYEVLKLWEIKI
ncbi:MAG: CHAD domain-containing protein [Eubacteriales bacterium]|nr:CHAD domain-containing protein [Eubacteriales bacterium]